MTRSPSTEPAPSKTNKRKGTRSVSSLTPSQLARKRANDREAQRAIRARTKEHIESLERQLEDLKAHHSRDRTVQELIRRNKSLEDELARLRDSMGISINSSPYSAPAVYDDNGSAGSGTMPSPSMSPLASSGADYGYSQQHPQQPYVAGVGAGDGAWAGNNLHSNVSSPSSSGNAGDEYGYIPTSVPTTLMPTSSSLHALDSAKFDMSGAAMHMPSPYVGQHQHQHQHQHPHQHPHHASPPQQQHGADWGVYDMYYSAQMPPKGNDFSTAVCMTR